MTVDDGGKELACGWNTMKEGIGKGGIARD